MSERVVLPSGGWADLCDPAEVPERYVRPLRGLIVKVSPEVRAAITNAGGQEVPGGSLINVMQPGDIEVFGEMNDLQVCALVTAWSYPLVGKRPTLDEVLDLPSGDYRALQEAAAKHTSALMGGVDFSPSPDPGLTPTVPSGT